MVRKVPIALAYGNGIGPEIMKSVLLMLQEAGAELEYHPLEIGEKVYLEGEPSGITPDSWRLIKSTEAFLKAPITTPQGSGFKSVNVTLRAALGLYANIRPCKSFTPYIRSHHPAMDLVIIRENEEDLYTGVEYRPTPGMTQALKMSSYEGCERIIRAAFEYAVHHRRKKVSCFSKDNILKMTDGLFHHLFEEIGREYSDIEKEHWIVDIGSARLADTPEIFDVIVTSNLYGDIISDIAAQVAGSVAIAGSANIGHKHAMFEAIHGSAPQLAGQDRANPSGLLMASIMMLKHLGQIDTAQLLYNAWACTIEEGIHTEEICQKGSILVGTAAFTKAVCQRLGQTPRHLALRQSSPSETSAGSAHTHSKPAGNTSASNSSTESTTIGSIGPSRNQPCLSVKANSESYSERSLSLSRSLSVNRQVVGIDLFIYLPQKATESASSNLDKLSELIQSQLSDFFELRLIANRGIDVWPHRLEEVHCVDQWRARVMTKKEVTSSELLALATHLSQKGIDICQLHLLYNYDDKPGYTQGSHDQ